MSLDDVITFPQRKLFTDDPRLPLPFDVFIQLILSFSFEGRFSSMTSGVAMGSPLSPAPAILFMEYFESESESFLLLFVLQFG